MSGALTGTSNTTGSVGAATTFNGTGGLTPITQTVNTTYTAPTAASATVNLTAYQKIESLDILSYGSVATISVPFVGNIETRIVYNPPARDKRFTLNAGGSFQFDQNYTSTVTPPGTSQTTASSTTVTYVGQESVSVPAGTFTACKFTDTTSGTTSTTWIIKGKGILAKSVSPSSSGDVTLQLQSSSRLNGSPI